MAYNAGQLLVPKDSRLDSVMKSDVSAVSSRHRTMPISTTAVVFTLLVSLALGASEADGPCPVSCYCDAGLSLVSCAGPEDDTAPSNNGLVTSDKNGTVPPDVWRTVARRGAQRLEVIDLAVASVRREMLNGTEHMIELSLVRCSLAAIGNGTFARHAALDRLDLSQNQLTVLSQVT